MAKKNALCLADQHKESYIRDHLFNELRWLLGAATEWSLQAQLRLEIVGYNVQVYAMGSAFVHARALFEFFVGKPTPNHYSAKNFGFDLVSSSYGIWKDDLHSHLMHLQDRSSPAPSKSSSAKKSLNEMPVDFAREILRLWQEFEEKLAKSSNAEDQKLGQLARERRKKAIERARCVLGSVVARHHAEIKRQQLNPVF
jgi:hypothetical protein